MPEVKMKCFSSLPLGVLIISSLAQFSEESTAPLFFEKEPNNLIAVTGKNAIFHCKAVAAGKKITYFWKLNGYFINEDNDNGFKILNGMLQIFNVTSAKHSGAYECVAFNKDLGSIRSKTAKLEIAYIYRERFIKWRTVPVDLERPTMIQAPTYRAFPAPTFKWEYEKVDNDGAVYVNISYDKDLYVTLKGNLLIPSTIEKHLSTFKVLVTHPAMAVVDSAFVQPNWLSARPNECENSNLTTFPTVTKKTAYEGSDVVFECLAVPKRCYFVTVQIKWVKKATPDTFLNETSRMLVLKNVTKKSHEGIYECQASLDRRSNTLNITYALNVVEKPKLVKAVKPIVSLPANGILHPAVFDKTASLKWYKDGSVIDKSSTLFDVFPNGNLKIKHPSPAFNGIYQMVYENQAGTKAVSQTVTVNSKVGCGQRIFKLSGSITYNQETPSWKDISCTWLFQLPSAKKMQFKITKFKFHNPNQAMLSIFEGSTASQRLSAEYSFNVAYVSGPLMSMVFSTKASNVGSFTVDYWPTSEGPATTVATERSKVQPTTTKSTKQEPVKAKQTGCKGGCNTGAIVGGIFGVLILIALIVLIIYSQSKNDNKVSNGKGNKERRVSKKVRALWNEESTNQLVTVGNQEKKYYENVAEVDLLT